MSVLAVLFSLDNETISLLKSFEEDADRLAYLQEEIEESYFSCHPTRLAELDKSWDALHRSLTNGLLTWTNGSYPLNHVILGGERIYQKTDYIMVLKTPQQVKDIYSVIQSISKAELQNGYNKITEDYGVLDDDDFEYTWEWFSKSFEFWRLAAIEDRYVLFTVDQ